MIACVDVGYDQASAIAACVTVNELSTTPTIILIDGFVWLDANGRKGLGARLFDSLGGTIPIVGVAKTSFATATNAKKVYRGGSSRPLFVTAVGIDEDVAATAVQRMHGQHRLPTMLSLVDRLSKGLVSPNV